MATVAISRIPVFLNPHAGGRDAAPVANQLKGLFAEHGLEAAVTEWPKGGDVAAAIRAATAEADAVVAAGGDGTVSAVAAVVAGTPIRLGVLPLGTRNHFARDAGIPFDLAKAVATIAGGHVRAVDAGEVNGRIFVNNCSAGVYPTIVKSRDALERDGHRRWLSLALATLRVLPRHPRLKVTVDTGGVPTNWRTPLVLVANNAYDTSGVHLGNRARLDEGELVLYLAPHVRSRDLPKSLLAALLRQFGRRTTAPGGQFHAISGRHIRIGIVGRPLVDIAIDGEVVRIATPLDCRSRPGAVRLLVPED